MTTPDPITVLRDLLTFWRSFDGPATFDEIRHPAIEAAKALVDPAATTTRARVSRWRCPECGSPKVQIGLPAWHREYGLDGEPGELEYVETDAAADVMWWYCEDCGETESGLPELNDPDVHPGSCKCRDCADAKGDWAYHDRLDRKEDA